MILVFSAFAGVDITLCTVIGTKDRWQFQKSIEEERGDIKYRNGDWWNLPTSSISGINLVLLQYSSAQVMERCSSRKREKVGLQLSQTPLDTKT